MKTCKYIYINTKPEAINCGKKYIVLQIKIWHKIN
jgi:hypothetical protein